MSEFQDGFKKRMSKIKFYSNPMEWLQLFFLKHLPSSYLESAYDSLLKFECEPWSEKDDQVLLDWVTAKNLRLRNQGQTPAHFFDNPYELPKLFQSLNV